jgi:hypothetical protein
MKKENNINEFSIRGISISILLLVSIVLIIIPTNAYAEEINVTSVGLDKTAIITLTNNSMEDIKIFKIWPNSGFNFESFKIEQGWIGEKNSQGVIIFSSLDAIKNGESVKFGIKTDKKNTPINWKALNNENKELDKGIVISSEIPSPNKNDKIDKYQNIKNNKSGVFSDSEFRIIPDAPNKGSTIRVVGDNFGALQELNLYINTQKIGNFVTDENGHFITTAKIPNDQNQNRVDFKIKDDQGTEKKISIRVGELENRIPISENIKLTLKGLQNNVNRGDILEISGTANPNTAITVKINDPNNKLLNTRSAEVDSIGNWKIINQITIPFDAEYGKYSLVVSDGVNPVLKAFTVKTNKVILIYPTQVMFKEGELIKFNGTGVPNKQIELILENNQGDEMKSDILQLDNSGFIEFEYQTKENDDLEGTWTLIATQDGKKEFTYVGYGEQLTIPINLEFDKTNYKTTETAKINFVGQPSTILKMIIISPSGNMVGGEEIIELRADGRKDINLELDGLTSGIYTAVVTKGNSQSSETFSVGLQFGSGQIDAKITQMDYEQGEQILLLGNTNPNSLLYATLINPNGIEIKKVEMASKSDGIFTEERLKVPSNGIVGTWEIVISSGSNSDTVTFEVYSKLQDELSIIVREDIEIPGFGKSIKLFLTATHKTSIIVEIINNEQQVIDKLNCNTTTEFKCEVLWTISKDVVPGEYTIKAYDSLASIETKYLVK